MNKININSILARIQILIIFLYSASIYSCEIENQSLIWIAQKPFFKAQLALTKDYESLSNIICRELMVVFELEKRALKENLIVRWSPQKRRARVHQMLVRELHSGEKNGQIIRMMKPL